MLCVQKYRGVYKIYLHDEKDKTPLLINGIRYKDIYNNITIYEINPYECTPVFITEKIIIKGLPFNISNAKVLDELEGIDNISILSRVMYYCERDHMNNLTDCRNGDRFLYVRGPVILPLQKEMKICNEKYVILHKSKKITALDAKKWVT